MTETDLEKIFGRINRVDRMLKNLEKEISEINYTATSSQEKEAEAELPDKFLTQAEKTTDAFR
jgi:hypothetical protein